jgi:hypothetical protein
MLLTGRISSAEELYVRSFRRAAYQKRRAKARLAFCEDLAGLLRSATIYSRQ